MCDQMVEGRIDADEGDDLENNQYRSKHAPRLFRNRQSAMTLEGMVVTPSPCEQL